MIEERHHGYVVSTLTNQLSNVPGDAGRTAGGIQKTLIHCGQILHFAKTF